MRGKKSLVWISIVTMLVMAMWAGVGTSSSTALVYVDPLYSCAQPCETFDISVKAKNLEHGEPAHEELFVAEFFLFFDPGLLEVVDDPATPDIEGINPDDQPNSLEVIYYEQLKYDSITGLMEIRVVAGRPTGVYTGLNGIVGLAKISFHVIGRTSRTSMKLYWTDLICVYGHHIENTVMDGYFKNIYPILWIRKKGAHGVGVYPEWNSVPYSEGLTNTLYAKVVNTGEESANIRVKFKGLGPEGVFEETSNEATVAPGDSAVVSATMNVIAGTYDFGGSLEYEIEPLAIPPYPRWVAWEDVEGCFGGEGTAKEVGQGKFTVK